MIERPQSLFIRLWSYSEFPLSPEAVSVYSQDPSTRILACCYAFDDGDVKRWVPAQGEDMPDDLLSGLIDPRIVKVTFDKAFNSLILQNVHGLRVRDEFWRDLMVMALACSLPRDLVTLYGVLGLRGESSNKLEKHFCESRRGIRNQWDDNPPLWEEFLQHCDVSIIALRKCCKTLSNYDISEAEWNMWFIDQKINRAGIPIDTDMAVLANEAFDIIRANLRRDICQITGLKDPKDSKGILHWFEQKGYKFNGLSNDNMAFNLAILEDANVSKTDDLYRVLQMYRQINRTAPTKFGAILDVVDDDDRVRNAFQFIAALTGRWSGHGFQPQNLPAPARGLDGVVWGVSPAGHRVIKASQQILAATRVNMFSADWFSKLYDNPIDALTTAVRPVIKAPDGQVFIIADLKFAEVMVLGWLTDDKSILDILKEGKDPYLGFAVDLFDMDYDELLQEYQAGDKSHRNCAKAPELACGFGMGAGSRSDTGKTTGLVAYANRMGIDMSMDEADHAVTTYRRKRTGVVQAWSLLESAVIRCVQSKQEVVCGKVVFDIKGNFLRIKLPSGRFLYYSNPRIDSVEASWGKVKPTFTCDQNWNEKNPRVAISRGNLIQNIVSGIARDLFCHGMRLTHESGTEIVMHGHDELVGLSPIREADERLTGMIESMCDCPRWWGNKVPIRADGYITDRFVKV